MSTEFSYGRLFDLGLDPASLVRLRDEIFVDLPNRPDTSFMGAPSYQVAVRDCLELGPNRFLLKIRPDMHRVVFSELRTGYEALGVYSTEDEPGQRIVVTERVHVVPSDSAPEDEVAKMIDHYCLPPQVHWGLGEGEHTLRPEFTLDPIATHRAMEAEDAIAEVTPMVIQIEAWIPRSRSATDLIPMREIGAVLKTQKSKS